MTSTDVDRNPSMVKKPNIPVPPASDSNSVSNENVIFGNGRHEVNENGTAAVIDDEDQSQEKYFALHRTAPVGTIIRVLSMSNSRKVYVKVTGKLQDSPDNSGIILKMSKASAEKLDVAGRSFSVNLLYGVSDQ
jgi:hypothetical protein